MTSNSTQRYEKLGRDCSHTYNEKLSKLKIHELFCTHWRAEFVGQTIGLSYIQERQLAALKLTCSRHNKKQVRIQLELEQTIGGQG